jgi:hypothetical protein
MDGNYEPNETFPPYKFIFSGILSAIERRLTKPSKVFCFAFDPYLPCLLKNHLHPQKGLTILCGWGHKMIHFVNLLGLRKGL